MNSTESYTLKFRVPPGSQIRLAETDAGFTGEFASKKAAKDELKRIEDRLNELQYLLHASAEHALLLVFQAKDAGGKDGTIKFVLGAMNPQGCVISNFKVPTAEEAAHDFLWRCHKAAPAKGQVGVFNRSHYEDVLVVRVRNLAPEHVWSKRFDHINNFERLLADNGTRILKFYLHVDPDEQLERFADRLNDPHRQWKISDADYSERRLDSQYDEAFEDVFAQCSTEHAPWFVIPANRKWYRNVAVGRIVIEALESMDLKTPAPSVDLEEIRKKYHAAVERAKQRKQADD